MFSPKLLLFVCFFCPLSLLAQVGETAYNFLSFANSPHVNALGGVNISTISADNDFILQNPALLRREYHNMLNANYANIVGDINGGSAYFSRSTGAKSGAWGIGVNFLNYGKFVETTPENVEVGTFSANDLSLVGSYSYELFHNWRGGISGKFIYSSYEQYSALALAFDLGINYFNPENNLSFSAVIKDVGLPLKYYDSKYESLPWDIQLGLSFKLKHAPFRFSLTAYHLNVWDMSNYRTSASQSIPKKDPFLLTFAKHFVVGLDFVPTKNFYISLGFNPKIQSDFAYSDWSGFYGLSVGLGFKTKYFSLNASYGSAHVNASRLQLGITTKF